jgi:hypothetical protein
MPLEMLVSGEGLAAIGTEHHDGERSESGVAELGLRTAEGDPKQQQQQQQQQHGQRLRRFNESFSGVRSFQGAVQHGGVGGERGDAWAGGRVWNKLYGEWVRWRDGEPCGLLAYI